MPLDLEAFFGVIESVKEQLTRDMERGLRQSDISKATWALAGKEACDRVRNALASYGAQQDFAAQRDEEIIKRQKERADRRAAQRALKESQALADAEMELESAAREIESLPDSPPAAEIRTEIEKIHQSRTRLLRAIDARQFQQRRKSG